MIKGIFCWKVECRPWVRGDITNMTLYVVAESKEEAERIVLEQAHKFFDQDMHYYWSEPLMEGYRKE